MTTICSCLIILINCIALAAAQHMKLAVNDQEKGDKVITISPGGTLGCKVNDPHTQVSRSSDFPVWKAATGTAYRVHFVATSPFSEDPIDVPAKGQSKELPIIVDNGYYKYEIQSQDSASGQYKKCKDAEDDHDTGLDVGD